MRLCRPFRLLVLISLFGLVLSACGGPGIPGTPETSTAEAATPVVAAPTTNAPVGDTPTSAASPTGLPTIAIGPTIAIPPTIEIKTPTAAPVETTDAAVTAGSTATADATAATTATTDATGAAAVLDPKWYVDGDDNAVPDFLETELGFDPAAADCTSQQCGTGGEGAELLMERNTLLILDSSGSMAAVLGGERKIDAAKDALRRYVSVVSNAINLGFMVYGHKGNNTESGKAESCVGIELLAPLGQLQRDNIGAVLDQFQPVGWTPIAASLTQASEAFKGKENATNRIILVSDGIETCEGDPVAVAQQLHDQGLAIEIDVVGFGIEEDTEDARQLRRIAEVTEGSYYDAKTAADLNNYFKEQSEALAQQWDSMTCELQNSAFVGLCDATFLNKVAAEMRELRAGFAFGSPEAQAYDEIEQRIRAKAAEREQARDEAQARFDQLQQQYFDLRDQIRRAMDEQFGT